MCKGKVFKVAAARCSSHSLMLPPLPRSRSSLRHTCKTDSGSDLQKALKSCSTWSLPETKKNNFRVAGGCSVAGQIYQDESSCFKSLIPLLPRDPVPFHVLFRSTLAVSRVSVTVLPLFVPAPIL